MSNKNLIDKRQREKLLKKAKEIAKKVRDSKAVPKLNEISEKIHQIGQQIGAHKERETLLNLVKKNPNSPEVTEAFKAYYTKLQELGFFEKIRPLLREGIELLEQEGIITLSSGCWETLFTLCDVAWNVVGIAFCLWQPPLCLAYWAVGLIFCTALATLVCGDVDFCTMGCAQWCSIACTIVCEAVTHFFFFICGFICSGLCAVICSQGNPLEPFCP